MGAHDRQITGGREETIEGGVILRFPGDWVGPLEELVPFGPAADRESPGDAADFWGENSAELQDAVELGDQPPPPRREPIRLRRWLLPAGGSLAAALFAVAGVLGGSGSSALRVRAVPFKIAAIPPLAAAPQALKQRLPRPRTAHHPQRHPRSTQPTTASTYTTPTASPATTPSPIHDPPPASSSTAGNSSQSGGAFTLGGP